MKPVYKVVTKTGQYVCEVFDHPTQGFAFRCRGKMTAYAIPTTDSWSKERLQSCVRMSFGDDTLIVEGI